jgi:hypothetical protein
MAHSFIEAFGSEKQAFTAFTEDFPPRPPSWWTPATPSKASDRH